MTLEGVEILHQTEIMGSPSWFVPTIVFGGLAILAIVWIVIGLLSKDGTLGYLFGAGVLTVYLITMIICFMESVPTGRYKYKAIISEEASFEDIHKYYDVVDQEGKIWTLEEKETKK